MRQVKTALLLTILGSILGFAAWREGGTDFLAWQLCLAALGVTGFAYLMVFPQREHAPRIDRAVGICSAILFAYVLLQLLPLPLVVLEVLSPARAEMTRALGVVKPQWAAPISIMPERTFAYLLRMCAFFLMYLLVRETGWRLRERPWLAAIPLFAIGLFEAGAGLWQVRDGSPAASAVGTYLNRDLYGGLLAMITPFPALLLVLAAAGKRAKPDRSPVFYARVAASATMLLVLVLALQQSLSRMAVASSIAGLVFAAALYAASPSKGRGRWLAIALAGGFVIAVWAIAPQRLISRYEDLAKPGRLDANRLPVWNDALRLIADYPLTGCGLGCNKSANLAYKTAMPLYSTDYAHSDYLQAIAELGIPGFLIALAAACFLFREVVRAGRSRNNPEARCLALACAAAMAGLAIHSLVDFNLHLPSSMLVLAWIAGLGSAVAAAPVGRVP